MVSSSVVVASPCVDVPAAVEVSAGVVAAVVSSAVVVASLCVDVAAAVEVSAGVVTAVVSSSVVVASPCVESPEPGFSGGPATTTVPIIHEWASQK